MEEQIYRLLYELENRHWWFRGRDAVVDALLAHTELPPSPRILDAGCGTGRNLQRYAQLGSVVGVDPSPDAIEFCRRRGIESVLRAAVESMPFEEGSFDLLMATDVLEHTADDGRSLAELRRVAAPGATLVMTVPALEWLWSKEDERLAHARRYTRKRLWEVTAGHGWEPAFATYFNLVLLPAIAAVRKLRDLSGRTARAELSLTPGRLNGPLSLPMRLEAKVIRSGLSLPIGVSLGVVCRAA